MMAIKVYKDGKFIGSIANNVNEIPSFSVKGNSSTKISLRAVITSNHTGSLQVTIPNLDIALNP